MNPSESPTQSGPTTEVFPDWEKIDIGPLSWVMTELREAFAKSLEDLRKFGQNLDDPTNLRMARAHLHRAHGALQLVNLEGVSLITEEIEHLFESLEANPVYAHADAIETVASAYRAITEYLEELLTGVPHQPVRLFPSYRALLNLRSADRIHPADLFYPDLSVRPPRATSQSAPLAPAVIAAQRARFERSLLQYLRDDTNLGAADEMRAAVSVIEAAPKEGQQRAFWWVTRAFFEALSANAVPTDLNVKRLCARINLQIRRLLDGSGTVAERLLRDTLFFVARSQSVTPHINDVKRVYQLDNALPDDFENERYGQIDFAALRNAKEALTSAKAAWTMVVAGDVSQVSGFARDAGTLLSASGALNRPGLAHVAQVIASIGTELSFDPRKPSEAVGLDVATALLFFEGALEQARVLDESFDARAEAVVARVEASAIGAAPEEGDTPWLDEISRQAQERLTMASFIAEMQTNLRSVEKTLDLFFRDPTQRAELPQAEKLLGQIGGALSVLGHDQAGMAVESGRTMLRHFGEPDYQADPAEFERIAQSLGAVGFYIEQIQHRSNSGTVFRFDAASGVFTADLARAPVSRHAAEEDPEPDPQPSGPAGPTSPTGPDASAPESTLEEEIARRGDAAASLAESLRDNPDDQATRTQLTEALQRVQQDAMLVDDSALKAKAAEALKHLKDNTPAESAALSDSMAQLVTQTNRLAGHDAPAAAVPQISAPLPVASAAIDAELLEIFLMEAEEVLGNARVALTELTALTNSREHLTTLRRAFHTLKGSGRMVGLNAFGEAGWAVEQTMNHWLAEGRAASPDLIKLVDSSIEFMQAWVGELTAKGTSERLPDAIVEASTAVREGKSASVSPPPPPRVTAPPAAGASTPPPEESWLTATEVFVPDDQPQIAVQPLYGSAFEEIDFGDGQASQIIDPGVALDVAAPVDFTVITSQIAAAPVEVSSGFGMQGPVTAEPYFAPAQDYSTPPEVPATDATAPVEALQADSAPLAASASELPFAELPNAVTGQAVPAEALDGMVSATDAHPVQDVPETSAADAPQLETVAEFSGAVSEVVPEEIIEEITASVPAEEPAEASFVPSSDGTEFFSFDVPTIAPPAPPVVLPFITAVPSRPDEVKNIGPLTLSVPLYNIYLSEADELLRALANDFGEWRHELHRDVSEGAVRAAHSLSGTSATIGLIVVHDLAYGVEAVLQSLWRHPVPVQLDEIALLEQGVEALRAMLHRFAAEILPDQDYATLNSLRNLRDTVKARYERANGTSAPAPTFEPSYHSGPMLEPVPDVPPLPEVEPPPVLSAEPAPEYQAEPPPPAEPQNFGAQFAEPGFPPPLPAEPAFAAPQWAASEVVAPQVSAPAFEVQAFAADPAPLPVADAALFDVPALPIDDSPAGPAGGSPAAAAILEVSEPVLTEAPFAADVQVSAPQDLAPLVATDSFLEPASVAEPVQEIEPDDAQSQSDSPQVRDEIDPELIDIFLQEASEYMPQIGANLRAWKQNPSDLSLPQSLLRVMHTVKGSARMAGAMRLGELVHEMEARVELGVNLKDIPASLFDELMSEQDRAMGLYDHLMNPQAAASASSAPSAEAGDDGPVVPAIENHDAAASAAVTARSGVVLQPVLPAGTVAAGAMTPGTAGAFAARGAGVIGPGTQQVVQAVRVRADVLDRLVNQAGEVSISRSRLENEVGQIKSSLGDLTENLGRLRSQLREIEIQAESQMQSQMQSMAKERFDPLEFDRFTRLQELTRMMAESVNDVATVQQNLVRSLDGANRDLLAQQRMTRDLQQDLMRVRMVPFGSVSERLYRVVRQTAKELDKRVNLDIRGGTVEIDRGVLERMAAPFEHLLRNAIVHGIESRADRMAAGKSETGELLVEVRQEGNEIVLIFSDDGAGLNLSRIREKARVSGLLEDSEDVADQRVADLIFQPGFSTATEVTELAGRGVGMDVVRAEAGGLGGRVSVDTNTGAGTRFTINLPLTLAVTQVVLVTVASRTYALPSVLVEQVQQLKPQPLAQAYNDGQILWLGQPVKLYFLAGLLGDHERSPIAQRYSPILILRSGGERIVIHVDEVIGNQEVVVKNIGPQLARMTGIAGATVLGSGDIVLILNPVQLAQQVDRERPQQVAAVTEAEIGGAVAELLEAPRQPTQIEPVAGLETLPTVMVVDDSLTVRRVTQRLLTREGYQVVLAKDGVDALQQLQDYTPDVMLVDIEMPRMDGFDLTRNVRGDERYHHIPIIMITSRTADKHRSFAMELGVNVYLGKPYQEDELLAHVAGFVMNKKRAAG